MFARSSEGVAVRDPGETHENLRRLRVLTDKLGVREEMLHIILDHAPVIMMFVDDSGRIDMIEGGALDHVSYCEEDLQGRAVYDVFKCSPKLVESCSRAAMGEEFTAVIDVKDRIFDAWFSTSISGVGGRSGVMMVATDITDRKLQKKACDASMDPICRGIVEVKHAVTKLESSIKEVRKSGSNGERK